MKWCVYVGDETVKKIEKRERMNEEALACVGNDATLHPFWTGSFLESSSWAFNIFMDLKLGTFFWNSLHFLVRSAKFLKYR
jgi:hypothetical protein